ncbi:MAG: bifunctional 4-hydroxy-2-oxoglutarate aldolase/2-dehydro-3-deoxy-phosphogluconate aldolase [Treponema sp.]|jgi:2-dehydro-3-deoxyphosphogluconate aldolase/(4S)-4-hydroxy-2-oxoglutarate aldolase|nr:bifunctional 4-hydroxy-2-oxoglutarate aldolase/2-dehydro-3-deoxy-phosphogluconate aldolase [Treponema sp.]
MHEILSKLEQIGIIPVIKIDDAANAVPLAKALADGGIPCAEVTFRTAQGAEAIKLINEQAPEVLLGAGTVLSVEQVDKAVAAGARFIVSPGFNPKVVAHCIEKGVPVVPGCANPSDMEQALEFGLEAVKFFPAEQAGGLNYIKAVAAPYSSLRFIPTGGINQDNIGAYTRFEKILACGGSWMVSADLINTGNFDKITMLCKEAVQRMLGFSMTHIGINTRDEEETRNAAKRFEAVFNFGSRETSASIFASDTVEIMKGPGMGAHGHIAIAVNSVLKALYHLERQGVAFNKKSVKYTDSGRLNLIYIKDEIAGFAVHLIQKK